jgi:hypothetical protein
MSEFNVAPEGWREISVEEFARSHFFIYSFDKYEYRQIRRLADGSEIEGPMLAVGLFHMHDNTGYGIRNDWWEEKVFYYKFGCEHEYKGLSQEECRKRGIAHFGRCYHVSECGVCGYVLSVDSSD